MTRTISDASLYDTLRAADPIAHEPQRLASATEAALGRLMARVEDPATAARIAPHMSPRQASRWWAMRLTPIVALGAAAAAVLIALPPAGPVSLTAASAKPILARAAAMVTGVDGGILQADITATQTWKNGGSDDWTEKDWQQVSPPYDDRSIISGVWPTTVERATVSGAMWLYDQSTNTVYTDDPRPTFTLTPGAQPGTYTLRPGDGTSGPSLTVSASQAAALRDGTDVWATDGNGGLMVVPRPTTGSQILSDFRSRALALMNSPTAKVTRNVTIDGQNAIEVASADGTTIYYLDPATYAPIQMTNTIGPGTNMGDPSNDSTVTLTFTDWQDLTGSAADPALLSLTAQHPHANVDGSASDYTAAEDRLFP